MPFQINAQAPPAGAKPYGPETRLIMPEATGRDGQGRAVGAVGYPSYIAHFPILKEDGLEWYLNLLGGEPSVELTSLQVYSPFLGDWTTYTGHATMHRPTIGGSTWRQSAYTDVRILFTDLY